MLGSPAIPVREQRRLFQMIARLPEMHRQFRELTAAARALGVSIPSLSQPRPRTRIVPEQGARRVSVIDQKRLVREMAASTGCSRRAEPIGLLAGSGRFPILFARAARRAGPARRLRGNPI